MISLYPIRHRWLALGAACAATAGLALLWDGAPALALVNESPSLPKGLYARRIGAEPVRGATVAIPQPPAARAYLRDLGMPASVLLLKRVAAVEGDEVCFSAGGIRTAGRWIASLEHDRRGVRLPRWRDCRRMGEGEVFLLGDTPGSFDSRYFGPVPTRSVRGVYREVLTW